MIFEGPSRMRGEKAKEFIGRAKEKRVNPRDLEGTPQAEKDIAVLRELDKKFSKLWKKSGYVGLSYRGSSSRGYSKPGMFLLRLNISDLDVGVIVDPTDILNGEAHDLVGERMIEIAHETFRNRGFGKKPINFLRRSFALEQKDEHGNVVPLSQRLLHALEDPMGSIGMALAFFAEDMIGPRVAEYRGAIVRAMAELPKETYEKLLATITDTQMTFEREKLDTLKERFPEEFQTKEQIDDYFKARHDLWKKRVYTIYKIPNA